MTMKPREAASRAAASTLIRALVPGRARLAVALYDRAGGRSFRGLPGYSRTFDVADRGELAALWSRIEALVEDYETGHTAPAAKA